MGAGGGEAVPPVICYYKDEGGWEGYMWQGCYRYFFLFRDSLQVGGYLAAGDNEGVISTEWSVAKLQEKLPTAARPRCRHHSPTPQSLLCAGRPIPMSLTTCCCSTLLASCASSTVSERGVRVRRRVRRRVILPLYCSAQNVSALKGC